MKTPEWMAEAIAAGGQAPAAVRSASEKHGELRSWYRIENADDGDSTADIYIYDEIDPFWGVAASDFVNDLSAVTATTITVHINSPGGDVFDGIAILNALRQHESHIVTQVDGLAASAASFIAMGGDEIVMAPNSQMMIHDPRGICVGTSKDMTAYAALLTKVSDNMAAIYAEQAGEDAAFWRVEMAKETWYTAEEAVAAGLADRVLETTKGSDAGDAAAKARAAMSQSTFSIAARLSSEALSTNTPRAVEAGVTIRKEGTMPTLNESLAEILGVAADAGDDAVVAAVKSLKEKPADSSGTEVEPSPVQIQSGASKLGMTLVPTEQWETTKAAAEQGAVAHKRQVDAHRKSVITAAVKAGKIPPANVEAYDKMHAKDPEGTEAFLNGLPAGVIPVEELGHSAPEDHADAGWFYDTTPKEA